MSTRSRFARPPGMPKPCRPFRIRWRSFVSICGPLPFLPCRLLSTIWWKFHECFLIASWTRSLSLRDQNSLWIKPSSEHMTLLMRVIVLLSYALSGEPTIAAFYERLAPFRNDFLTLFHRHHLPSRSALSRFLAAL